MMLLLSKQTRDLSRQTDGRVHGKYWDSLAVRFSVSREKDGEEKHTSMLLLASFACRRIVESKKESKKLLYTATYERFLGRCLRSVIF
jgi:hypothetical protein